MAARLGSLHGIFQRPGFSFPSRSVSPELQRILVVHPEWIHFRIHSWGQGFPGKQSTHHSHNTSKILMPQGSRLIYSTTSHHPCCEGGKHVSEISSSLQLGRERVVRLCGSADLAMLDESKATPRLLATVLLMLALYRGIRGNSKQRRNLFQAAAENTSANEHCSFMFRAG